MGECSFVWSKVKISLGECKRERANEELEGRRKTLPVKLYVRPVQKGECGKFPPSTKRNGRTCSSIKWFKLVYLIEFGHFVSWSGLGAL